jgi:hypothetical protein
MEKEWLPFKQNYLPQVLLISDEFEIPQLTELEKYGRYSPRLWWFRGKISPVMYLQDAQNLFNEDAEYGNWEIDKTGNVGV